MASNQHPKKSPLSQQWLSNVKRRKDQLDNRYLWRAVTGTTSTGQHVRGVMICTTTCGQPRKISGALGSIITVYDGSITLRFVVGSIKHRSHKIPPSFSLTYANGMGFIKLNLNYFTPTPSHEKQPDHHAKLHAALKAYAAKYPIPPPRSPQPWPSSDSPRLSPSSSSPSSSSPSSSSPSSSSPSSSSPSSDDFPDAVLPVGLF